MSHIRSLFKTVALFWLSTVLCQACGFFSKTNSMPKRTSKAVLQDADQKPLESPEQQVLESTKQSDDKKALQNEMVPLVQKRFMLPMSPTPLTPSQPTAPTASQGVNQEKLQKGLRDYRQWNIAQAEKMLANASNLSGDQIEKLTTLDKDVWSKLEEQFSRLPIEKLQCLCDYMKSQEALEKDVIETGEQLESLLKQSMKSLEEDRQIEATGKVPLCHELIEMVEEQCKIAQGYIHPENDTYLSAVKNIKTLTIDLYKTIEKIMLQCSDEAKQTYQTHLKKLLSLFKDSVKEAKKLKQIMPDSLVEEIQKINLETGKKVAAILKETQEPMQKKEEEQALIEQDLD